MQTTVLKLINVVFIVNIVFIGFFVFSSRHLKVWFCENRASSCETRLRHCVQFPDFTVCVLFLVNNLYMKTSEERRAFVGH